MRAARVLAIAVGILLLVQPALAFEQVVRFGVIEKRDVVNRTLQIGGYVYHVGGAARLKGLDGRLLDFETFPIFDIYRGGLFDHASTTKAEVKASFEQNRWELHSLKLVERIPE